MAEISNKPWSQFKDSDYSDEQFKRAALLPGSGKSDSKFPVREPDGTLNRNAVHAASSRFNQANLSSEDKAKLKKKLRSLYSQIGEDPPDVLKDSETAYQTPFADGKTVELGNKLWRKRVLPYKAIHYDGGTLSFTKEKAQQIANSFKEGAFEFVPFIVGDGHSNDTTKNGGRVTGFDATDDGLDAIIQTNDEGERVINNHFGDLPVSVRFIEDYLRDSEKKRFGPAIQHVASTYMPRMAHMGPWKPENATLAEVADLSDDYEVVDLSGESYGDSSGYELSAEDQAVIDEAEREVADEADNGDSETPDEETEEEDDMANMPSEGDSVSFKRGGETWTGEFKRMDGENAIIEVDGEEVKVPASMLQKKSGSEGGSGESGAKDNSEGGSGVDLAELEARDRRIADLEAKLERSSESERRNTLELRRQKVERELEEYGRAGVPAADLDAARPLLMDDDSGVELSYTDLSEEGATEKKSPRADLVRRMLDSRKGTVEFGEKGDASAQLSEDDAKDKKIREYARENEMSYGEAARHVL